MNRSNFLLLCLLCWTSSLFAQLNLENSDGSIISNHYELYVPTKVYTCNDVDCSDTTGSQLAPQGARLTLIEKTSDGNYIVQFWEWEDSNIVNRKKFNFATTADEENNNSLFFKITGEDWNQKVIRRYSTAFLSKKGKYLFEGTTITAGILLLPYKIRPETKNGDRVITEFDFSKDISLGFSAGIKQRISHYRSNFLNIIGNVGVGNISLSPANSSVDTLIDVPALTIAVGAVFEFNKVQIGAFIGWDRIADRQRNDWMYQGRPWISVGLGYSLFTINTADGQDTPGKN